MRAEVRVGPTDPHDIFATDVVVSVPEENVPVRDENGDEIGRVVGIRRSSLSGYVSLDIELDEPLASNQSMTFTYPGRWSVECWSVE